MRARVFLPIETTTRELDAKLLIALRAISQDSTVTVGSKASVIRQAIVAGGGHLLYKDHSNLSWGLLRELDSAGVTLSAHDEEGLLFDIEDYAMRVDRNLSQILRNVFAWGDIQLRAINNISADFGTISKLTGSPRIELLEPKFAPYRQLLGRMARATSDHIQINLNSPAANWNPKQYGTPTYLAHMQSRGLIGDEGDVARHRKVVADARETFRQVVLLVAEIRQSFPHRQVVVRPHPDEDIRIVRKAFAQFQGVTVTRRGSHLGWIESALVCISTNCTTGIEAGLMGRHSINFTPHGKGTSRKLVNLTTVQESTSTEVLNVIAGADRGDIPGPLDSESIRPWLYGFREESASHIIASQLVTNTAARCEQQGVSLRRLPEWGLAQIERIRVARGHDGKRTFEATRNVRVRLHCLAQCLSTDENSTFRIQSLAPNVWHVDRRDGDSETESRSH